MAAAFCFVVELSHAYGQETAAGVSPVRVEKIRVDRDHHRFVDEDGRPFVPFGVSYYRPGTGWAPQVWKDFDPEATHRDFMRLKQEGANVIRIFISSRAFWNAPTNLDPVAIAKFDKLLDLADEAGLHVHPTGPGGWEGAPAWLEHLAGAQGLTVGNPVYLDALKNYWTMFALHYRGRKTIWAYDLQNEPAVPWQSPLMETRWKEWREAHQEAEAPIPDPKASPPDPNLLEFQHFRESLATEWIAVQAKAIHQADPDALVSVGLIQWSVPAQQLELPQCSAFRPAAIAPSLDFMELHFYPLAFGVYTYAKPEDETANLSVLESMARECAKPNLPLVISEFGWYGGGSLKGTPVATEEQQAQWCRHLVEVTAPLACGWLNWGMYDDPQASDVSTLTGLFTVDGHEKAWGRTFHELADKYRNQPPVFDMPLRPDLPWDSCLVSGSAMDDFRKRYLDSFKQQNPVTTP